MQVRLSLQNLSQKISLLVLPAKVHVCTFKYTHTAHSKHLFTACLHLQRLVLAFMMLLHPRLGADSPLFKLDADVTVAIAKSVLAEGW
jgi:hypothetical protein